MLHIDIYSTDKKFILTCVDTFSKFGVVQPLLSRAIIDVRSPILQLINFFPNIKTIYCDNEASFNSATITSFLKNQYNIDIVNAHSSSHGQVERFHSTLTDQKVDDTVELIMRAPQHPVPAIPLGPAPVAHRNWDLCQTVGFWILVTAAWDLPASRHALKYNLYIRQLYNYYYIYRSAVLKSL